MIHTFNNLLNMIPPNTPIHKLLPPYTPTFCDPPTTTSVPPPPPAPPPTRSPPHPPHQL